MGEGGEAAVERLAWRWGDERAVSVDRYEGEQQGGDEEVGEVAEHLRRACGADGQLVVGAWLVWSVVPQRTPERPKGG